MVERMVEKYLSLGDKVKANAGVEEILIEDGVTKGVQMEDGNKEYGSYIIPACDIDITFNKLLKGKYMDKKFVKRYLDPDKYPLSSCVYLSFAVDAELQAYPENFVFESSSFTCREKTYHKVSMHHYCYDNFAPKGKSIVISTISTDEDDYFFWKHLKQNPSKYREEKMSLSNKVITCIEERFPELKGKITTLDVATPVTYERYCGAYHGAWMSFMQTPKSEQMIHNGKIKGIDNLFMSGQWLMPPGGLPVALVTGKWAIQRICKKEKIHFEQGLTDDTGSEKKYIQSFS